MTKDNRPEVLALLTAIKEKLPELKELQSKVSKEWNFEDGIYRFYHQSFKVFYLQDKIKDVVKVLQELQPDQPLNESFLTIVEEGLSKKFDDRYTNENWLKETGPILTAFFHAKFFLEMVIKYGELFAETGAPNLLPSGWASVLYLYGLR